jgi:hypothetical protein
VEGEQHATTALPPRKEPPLPSGYEAGWASEPIWTTWRSEDFLPYRDSNSDTSVVQPVASRYIDCANSSSKYHSYLLMLHITFGHKPRSFTLKQHDGVRLVLKNIVLRKNFRQKKTEVPRETVNSGLGSIARFWGRGGGEATPGPLPSGVKNLTIYVTCVCHLLLQLHHVRKEINLTAMNCHFMKLNMFLQSKLLIIKAVYVPYQCVCVCGGGGQPLKLRPVPQKSQHATQTNFTYQKLRNCTQ